MELVIGLIFVTVAVVVGGSVAYLVLRTLDRSDVDTLRGHIEKLEQRLGALEAERKGKKPEA